MAGPVGSHSDGEPEPPHDSGPFFPHAPDTEFYTFILRVAEQQNKAYAVKLIDGNKWGLYPGPTLPDPNFVQSTVEAVDSPYQPSGAVAGTGPGRARPATLSLGATASAAPAGDPLAACLGGK